MSCFPRLDGKYCPFCIVAIAEDTLHHTLDRASFIEGTINVVYQNGLRRQYVPTNALPTRGTLSFKIDQHLDGFHFRVGPDTMLNTINALIKLESHIIESAEMLKYRRTFPLPEIAGDDEPWEAQGSA